MLLFSTHIKKFFVSMKMYVKYMQHPNVQKWMNMQYLLNEIRQGRG